MAKTLDQFLAESGRQSTLDELGRQGQLDQARSDFASGIGAFAGGAPSGGGGGGGGFNFQTTVQEAIKLQQQATQPAVSSLQASIPELQQRFATERQQVEAKIEPLKQRYANLLEELKGQSKVREESQTRVTSGELAKRGITGSSTLAQQEIQSAVDPIRASLQTATKDVGLAQEEGITDLTNLIANLTGQEVGSTRDILNTIAQLQSTGAQAGIEQALTQGQFASTQQLDRLRLAQEQSQFGVNQQFAEREFQQVTLPTLEANLADIRSQIANRGKDGANELEALNLILGNTGTQFSTGFPNVDKLIAEGRYAEARALVLNP